MEGRKALHRIVSLGISEETTAFLARPLRTGAPGHKERNHQSHLLGCSAPHVSSCRLLPAGRLYRTTARSLLGELYSLLLSLLMCYSLSMRRSLRFARLLVFPFGSALPLLFALSTLY